MCKNNKCQFCEIGEQRRGLMFRVVGKLPLSTLREIKDELKYRKIIK